MNSENCKQIQMLVKEAGAHLEGKLPPHPGLTKRNPYAHLWERIKSTFGKSYKECSDEQLEDVVQLIQFYRNNPC